MKKRFLTLFVAVMLLLPVLCACATERYDLLYSVERNGYTYAVRGTSNRVKQVVVKQGEQVLFAKKVKTDASVAVSDGTYGLAVADLNFDGRDDVMVATETNGNATAYQCFLWNEEKQSFVKDESLSGLCNIRVDNELQAVFAFAHTYQVEPAYADAPEASISTDMTTKYVWEDGKLRPDVRASITFYSESNRYCYSVAYWDSEDQKLGDSDDNWLTPEEFAKNKAAGKYDVLYYFQ